MNFVKAFSALTRSAKDGDVYEIHFLGTTPKLYEYKKGQFEQKNGVHILNHTSQIINTRLVSRKEQNENR